MNLLEKKYWGKLFEKSFLQASFKNFSGRKVVALSVLILLLADFVVKPVKGTNTVHSQKERRGRVVRYVLDNGLTVILKENHFAPVAAMTLWVKVGSADEMAGEEGIAHVLEHMMFKGTAKRGVGQIAAEVESAGGDMNAYTSLDETVYYITMPSDKLTLGLDILADAVFHAEIDSKELKKELQVVLEEIKRGEDNPSIKLSHAVFRTAYQVHPYGRPIIGTEASVSSFTREKVMDFYRRWYAPDNAVLVVVGDFDSSQIGSSINTIFGAEKNPNRKKTPLPSRLYPQEPPQEAPRAIILQGELQESYLEIVFHIPSIKHEDIPALEVLSCILGEGESSRLYRTVRADKGLVNTIYSTTFTSRDPGLFFIGATLDGKNLEEALNEILSQIALVRKELIRTDELIKAKVNIESEEIYARESVQGEARKLGYLETVIGDIGFETIFLRRVAEVTAEDVRDVALKYLTGENITIAGYLPKRLKASSWNENSLANMARQVLAVQPSYSEVGDVVKVTLSNGIRLLIKENHAVPIVAMRASALGGVRFESPSEYGMNNFIARTMTKGTAKRSAEDIANQVDRIAGSLGGFSGRDSVGLVGEFLSRYFDEGLDLFADVLMNPTFPAKEVERQRKEIIAAIARIEDNPEQLAIDIMRKNLFDPHPYSARILGDVETVSKISRKDLITYYHRVMVPQNIVLAVVGDVRAEEVIEKMENAFKNFGKKESQLPDAPPLTPLKKSKKIKVFREKEQAQIVLGFRGASYNSQDRFALDVLAAILSGQGGRLFVELRDKQHLAYSVGAMSVNCVDSGFFLFYMGTRPENIEKGVKGIISEIEKVRTSSVSDVELRRAIEYIVGTYKISLQTDSSQAGVMSLGELYGIGWQMMVDYPVKIKQVTAEQVFEVAKKYLDLNRMVQVVLVPSKGGTTAELEEE